MSGGYCTYVGPYLEVVLAPDSEDVKVDNCRDQANCPNSDTAYCPQCGLQPSVRHTFRKVKVELYDIVDDAMYEPLREASSKLGPRFLIPNIDRSYCWLSHNYRDRAMTIYAENIQPDILAFCKDYEYEIQALKRVGSVRVLWGMINYYN